MTVFAALALVSLVRGWRAMREVFSETSAQPPQMAPSRREARRAVVVCLAITLVALAVIQLVPVSRENPPVQTAVQWDSTQTQNLANRACMNCHSNETTWPWYSYVAPSSWLTTSHVHSAREGFNLSELDKIPEFRKSRLPDDIARQIRNGAMPPKDYLMMHPTARLSDEEKKQLIEGLKNSLPK